jgi:hypothetical protein
MACFDPELSVATPLCRRLLSSAKQTPMMSPAAESPVHGHSVLRARWHSLPMTSDIQRPAG